MLGMGSVILLWHSLSILYNNLTKKVECQILNSLFEQGD